MSIADKGAHSYDEVPYESGPHPQTHPDTLATVATLFGMTPPAIPQCRVLELGCAGGSNLIPMALGLPEGRFVGLDLSPRQIADGRRTIDALGLQNIDMRVMDVMDVDDRLGEFDYIICHGVLSWVPRPVQDKILAICSAHLVPNGVVYVSYNTYPGWHSRSMVREMVLYHIDAVAAPRERVRQAREFLQFLAHNVSHPASPFAAAVEKELRLWRKAPDDCILYDPLSEVNEPFYFNEVIGRAAEHGLQFIAEAELWDAATGPSEDVRRQPDCSPDDFVRCEQHLDFLRGRTFRRSLFCHEGVHLDRQPQPELIERFLLRGRALPVARPGGAAGIASAMSGSEMQQGQIVVGAGLPLASVPSVQQFRSEEGIMLSTSKPWVKAALLTLFDLWPRSLAFEDICRQAPRHLVDSRDSRLDPLRDSAVLKRPLLRCALKGLVTLHLHRFPEVTEVGDQLRASPLARLQAKEGPLVTTLRHSKLVLSELDRQVLLRLDGRHNHGELLRAVTALVESGEITFEGGPAAARKPSTEAVSRLLAESLRRLALSGLLVG